MTTALETISKHAEVYARARSLLVERVTALDDGLTALRRNHLPAIRRAIDRAGEAENALRALVAGHPECFAKPKTLVIAGVRVGYGKGKGRLEFDDADAVVARIKKLLPDQAEVLIRMKETPVKEALAQLPAADLKKLGVSVTDAGEQVVVRSVDTEVDKLVDALLKGVAQKGGAA